MSDQMSRNESTPRWYYYINGQEFGPFPSAMMADWMRVSWFMLTRRCSKLEGELMRHGRFRTGGFATTCS